MLPGVHRERAGEDLLVGGPCVDCEREAKNCGRDRGGEVFHGSPNAQNRHSRFPAPRGSTRFRKPGAS